MWYAAFGVVLFVLACNIIGICFMCGAHDDMEPMRDLAQEYEDWGKS